MKRIVISTVLIVIAFLITVSENMLIKSCYEKIEYQLNIAEESVLNGNYKLAEQTAENIKNNWEKHEKYLALFISQDNLKEISLSVSKLKEFSNKNYSPLFNAECKQIDFLLTGIKNDENFSFTGIF